MMKTGLIAAAVLAATAGAAQAGGQTGSIGVGAEYQISGLGGPSVNYDAGAFHVGGFLGYSNPDGRNNTVFEAGGRLFYHLHTTTTSDFSFGGSIGMVSYPGNGAQQGDQLTGIFLEPSLQIRAFIVSNVALSLSAGLVLGFNDNQTVAIAGQSIGGSLLGAAAGAGLHYYFFGQP